MNKTQQSSLAVIVNMLRERGPMRAGDLGFEIWGKAGHRCKCENAQSTMFVRSASKMLYRAQSLGLVNWRANGPSRIWYATQPQKG